MTYNVIIDKKSEKKVYKILKKNNLEHHFDKAVNVLKNDKEAGKPVPKNRIPKQLIKTFNINNLFIYDLVRKHPGWRLLYTIKPDGSISIVVVILQVLNHHRYDRMFNY